MHANMLFVIIIKVIGIVIHVFFLLIYIHLAHILDVFIMHLQRPKY